MILLIYRKEMIRIILNEIRELEEGKPKEMSITTYSRKLSSLYQLQSRIVNYIDLVTQEDRPKLDNIILIDNYLGNLMKMGFVCEKDKYGFLEYSRNLMKECGK